MQAVEMFCLWLVIHTTMLCGGRLPGQASLQAEITLEQAAE
jgi:hypothetical protein